MPSNKDADQLNRLLTANERSLIAGCFIVLIVMLSLYMSRPWIAKPNVPHQDIVTEGKTERREVTASFFDSYVETRIELRYDGEAERGSPVKIEATIAQQRLFRRSPSYPDTGENTPQPQILDKLQWPIEISLEQGKIGRKLAKGTPLPVSVDWAPLVPETGNKALFVVNLINFNGSNTPESDLEKAINENRNELSLRINGVQQKANPSSDIVLTITTYKNGIRADLWEQATLSGSLLAFVLGSSILMNAIGRSWKLISARKEGSGDWVGEGVVLPNTTRLRMSLNGVVHEGAIRDGLCVIDGTAFSTLTAAAKRLGSKTGNHGKSSDQETPDGLLWSRSTICGGIQIDARDLQIE
jgi:hypothetical protein